MLFGWLLDLRLVHGVHQATKRLIHGHGLVRDFVVVGTLLFRLPVIEFNLVEILLLLLRLIDANLLRFLDLYRGLPFARLRHLKLLSVHLLCFQRQLPLLLLHLLFFQLLLLEMDLTFLIEILILRRLLDCGMALVVVGGHVVRWFVLYQARMPRLARTPRRINSIDPKEEVVTQSILGIRIRIVVINIILLLHLRWWLRLGPILIIATAFQFLLHDRGLLIFLRALIIVILIIKSLVHSGHLVGLKHKIGAVAIYLLFRVGLKLYWFPTILQTFKMIGVNRHRRRRILLF